MHDWQVIGTAKIVSKDGTVMVNAVKLYQVLDWSCVNNRSQVVNMRLAICRFEIRQFTSESPPTRIWQI
jgi:hypothetical protein